MDIQTILEKIKGWGDGGTWVYQVFAVVLIVVIANLILRVVLSRLQARLERTATPWDDAFLDALSKPLRTLLWVIGLAFAAQITQNVSEGRWHY